MKFNLKVMISITLLVAGLAVYLCSRAAIAQQAQPNIDNTETQNRLSSSRLRARAIVRGTSGSRIEGTVFFTERRGNAPEPGVDITAIVSGQPASLRPGKHGIHIHENGTCQPDFEAAGGHFDPGPFGNSTPVDLNHPYHMGDIPNLLVSQGSRFTKGSRFTIGTLIHSSSRITLSPGPLSVFDENGSAVIVHLNEDRGEPGVTGASGGGRIACGVIELVTDGQEADAEEAKIKQLVSDAVKSHGNHHK